MQMNDEDFIRRVYKMSVVLWAFGVVACLCVSGLHAAVGWTLGAAASFAVLWSLEWIVRRCFVPGVRGAKRVFARFCIIKLMAVLLVLGVVVRLGAGSFALIVAFCAGLILTQAVIVLKTAGQVINQRLNG